VTTPVAHFETDALLACIDELQQENQALREVNDILRKGCWVLHTDVGARSHAMNCFMPSCTRFRNAPTTSFASCSADDA
jgi:hypothetical protein